MTNTSCLVESAMPLFVFSEECGDFPHYAVQVRYRRERSVEEWLQMRGYHPFVARYKSRRKWSDRIIEIETPLFPGYVFCSFDIKNRLPVLSVPGVLGIAGAGKDPIPIDPAELDAIRAVVALGTDVQCCPMMPGQRIRIETGPLKGVEGVLLRSPEKNRIIVSISLLSRSISAVIEGSETLPI